MLIIEPTAQPVKGFHQKEAFKCPDGLLIVTGRNGVGKTRLFHAIRDGALRVSIDGSEVSPSEILLLQTSDLQAGIEHGNATHDEFRQAREGLLAQYLQAVHGPQPGQKFIRPTSIDGMSSALQIAERTLMARSGLPREHLIPEEVIDEIQQSPNVLGQTPLANIFAHYSWRLQENRLAEFLHKEHGEERHFYTQEEFERKFGRAPWEEFQALLHAAFAGKFALTQPQKGERTYKPALINTHSGAKTMSHDLSSGEKTLLWLLMALFGGSRRYLDAGMRLLLLDEPDAFLHPALSAELERLLHAIVSKLGVRIAFTTHSPTTIALARRATCALMSETGLSPISRDAAVSDLLQGVTSIAVDLENRRYAFVESASDAAIYEQVLLHAKTVGELPLNGVSISFVPASAKVPREHIVNCIERFAPEMRKRDYTELLEAINGAGDCGRVRAAVEALSPAQDGNFWGIVDWDLSNSPKNRLVVHGEGIFYTLENAVLNPVALGAFMLHYFGPETLELEEFKGFHGLTAGAIDAQRPLQELADATTRWVLGDVEGEKVPVSFLQGGTAMLSLRYIHSPGHPLAEKIVQKFDRFRRFRPLTLEVARKGFYHYPWSIPSTFRDLFIALQK